MRSSRRPLSALRRRVWSHLTTTTTSSSWSRSSVGVVGSFHATTIGRCVGSHRRPSHRGLVTTTPSLPDVTLYRYNICPFCHKTQALFDYLSVPYAAVEVNPLTKAELKPWSGDYRKVPIALLHHPNDGAANTQHNGSHAIIAALLEDPAVTVVLEDKLDTTDTTPAQFRASQTSRWAAFADDRLSKILYPNICRTLSDSYEAFAYVDDVEAFSTWQKLSVRYAGSVAMYLAAGKIKKKMGVEDERLELHHTLDEWERDGLDHGKKAFASGTATPDLGDLAVFGTLRSIERLSTFRDVMETRDGDATRDWYDRMTKECS